ncbi:hypothetical protein EC988_005166 [Linderina pennispora]|nr:hypothetical protein EC988_005166 [Linderina pennispora]
MSRESTRGLSDSPAINGEGVLSTEDIPESALLPPSATFSTGANGNTFDESDFKPSSLESLPPIADPATVEALPELEPPRKMRHMSVSSDMKEAITKAWGSLESKYSQNRQLDAAEIEASSIDPNLSIQSISNVENLLSQDATRVLNVLLSMRKELTEAKQQLATVSRVAIERVTEAERGRKAALQEAIYLKAKASALSAASPALVGKLNSHRIHELERLYANTLNDNDALRNQLANANLSLKQAQDALSEFKHDAELTRAQHRELEQLYAQAQKDEEERQMALERSRGTLPDDAVQTIADLEQKLADVSLKLSEKQTECVALAGAERQRAERMDSALKSAEAATERAERVQLMLEESLAKSDRFESQAMELSAEVEKQKANSQRSEDRAARFEQLWNDAKKEISAFGALRSALEQMEDKEKVIQDLERKLSDAQERVRSLDRGDSSGAPVMQPRGSFASDASSSGTAEQRIKEFQAAYLAAHRQWSEARDELLSLRTTLRETDDRRRDMETKLAERERELDDMQARLSAFTDLLQEYAAKNGPRVDSTQTSAEGVKEKLDRGAPNSALLMSDDEISVSNMLAAIQQLQRTSSIGSRPSADALKAPPASDLVN